MNFFSEHLHLCFIEENIMQVWNDMGGNITTELPQMEISVLLFFFFFCTLSCTNTTCLDVIHYLPNKIH